VAKKNAQRLPHLDYSDIDVYVEEAKNIEVHKPAMVTVFGFAVILTTKPRIRIIPSKEWGEAAAEQCVGLFSHESIHVWLAKNIAPHLSGRLDFLPRPESIEEARTGVFGLGLRWEVKEFLK